MSIGAVVGLILGAIFFALLAVMIIGMYRGGWPK